MTRWTLPLRPAVVLTAAGALAVPACSTLPRPTPAYATAAHEDVTTVAIRGRALTVHTAWSLTPSATAPLVVFASGDGGWFGTAIAMWRQMAASGYPTLGFSARALLADDRGAARSVADLAADYQHIIAAGRQALRLPVATPVVLAGWSRGAAFAVLAAADARVCADVRGVLAIGLAERENLRADDDDADDDGAMPDDAHGWPYDTYTRLGRLRVPAAVIQATRDNYFPADRARQRFGADSATRRLYAVAATNHRFAGGGAAFVDALHHALPWLADAPSNPSLETTSGACGGSQ